MSSAIAPAGTCRGRRARRRPWLPSLALAVLLLAAAAAPAQDAARIAYVDMKRLLDNAPQLVEANARLTREFQARDQRVEADRRRLAELEARQRSATGSAATALAGEITTLRRSVERTEQRLREELQKRLDEELDLAFPRMSEAVADYAREQGYDLVVQSPVIYASGRIDITDAVLDRLRRDSVAGNR